MRQIPHLVGVLPLHDLRHRVGAGDEEQLGVGMLRAQVAQRIDGVGDARPVDVDAGHGEFRVRRGGDHRHQITVLGVGDLLVELEDRPAGRHENHLVEVIHPGHLRGGDQVAVVDRVEGSAHDADARAHVPVAARGEPLGSVRFFG